MSPERCFFRRGTVRSFDVEGPKRLRTFDVEGPKRVRSFDAEGPKRVRSFDVERPKTEKVPEPTVESLERLRYLCLSACSDS